MKPLQWAAGHGHGQPPCRGGWPPTAKAPPYKGAAGCGQPPYKGRPASARTSPQGSGAHPRPNRRGSRQRVAGYSAAPARGGSRQLPCRRGCCQRSTDGRPRPACKGRPTAGSAHVGRQLTGRGTARKGCRLQGRPPATVAPAGATPVEVPAAGVAAPWHSGCRRARATVACAGATAAVA
ncbi:hypothetical protein BHE74_00034437 [Ensete ventricosum]|nr:hypothetical protein BHE74_00034437 [Ensete ventricosum]